MKSPEKKKSAKAVATPKKKGARGSVPVPSETGHQNRFDQLLDDSILGVKPKAPRG